MLSTSESARANRPSHPTVPARPVDAAARAHQRQKRGWFHPTINGVEAEELLRCEPDGSFLLRPSRSSPGDCALSVKRGMEIVHIQVHNLGDHFSIEGNEERYASLSQLVAHIRNGALVDPVRKLLKLSEPVLCRRPTYERWFHDGKISSEEAESLLLSRGVNGSFFVRASSSKPGDYVISIRYCDRVAHTLISCTGDKYQAGPDKTFDSLAALVEDIKSTPMNDPATGQTIHLKELAKTQCRVADLPKILTAMDTARSSYTAFDGFDDEFQLVMADHRDAPAKIGKIAGNRRRNRYPNVVPFDDNRVLLNARPAGCFAKPNDYINASHIQIHGRDFIATQAPLKNTIEDFWSMVWEERSGIVVMLIKEIERGQERTATYWPTKSSPIRAGNLCVSLVSEESTSFLIERVLAVQNKYTNETREIHHLQLLSWPESGVVSFGSIDDLASQLLAIDTRVEEIRSTLPDMLTGPPVVHCSAGLGRTGVYIAVTVLAAHIREKGREADIDIAKLVSALRDQREGMVQTPDQYRLLYSAVMVCAGLSESLLPGGEGKFRVPYTTVSFQPAGPSAAATFQPVEPARVS